MNLNTYLSLPNEEKLLDSNIHQLDYESLVQAYQIIEDEALSAKILAEMDNRIENNPSYQKAKQQSEEYTQKYLLGQNQKKQREQQRWEELNKERVFLSDQNNINPLFSPQKIDLSFYSFLGNLMIIAGIIGIIVSSICAVLFGGNSILYLFAFIFIQCLGAIILLLRKISLIISQKPYPSKTP